LASVPPREEGVRGAIIFIAASRIVHPHVLASANHDVEDGRLVGAPQKGAEQQTGVPVVFTGRPRLIERPVVQSDGVPLPFEELTNGSMIFL
jgi:hypothetical protein